MHLSELKNIDLSWDIIAAKVIPKSISPKAKAIMINREYFISMGNSAKILPTFVIMPDLYIVFFTCVVIRAPDFSPVFDSRIYMSSACPWINAPIFSNLNKVFMILSSLGLSIVFNNISPGSFSGSYIFNFNIGVSKGVLSISATG